MLDLIFLKGAPASGKSTYAKKLVDDNPGKYKISNKDQLRTMIDNGKWSKANEKFVLDVRDFIIGQALRQGYSAIVDDTNLAPAHEVHFRSLAKLYKVNFIVKDFTDVSMSVCLERNSKRQNWVPPNVIEKMYSDYITLKPPVIEYDPTLPDCIICDVDGTIAKMNGRGPFEWHRVGEDLPIKHVIDVLFKYHDGKTNIIFLSGRDEICRQLTVDWLIKHELSAGEPFLYMRPKGDQRKDVIVKEQLYNEHIKGKFNVVAIFDDRMQMVSLWRSMGLPLFQCGDGSIF
jgi:predicted kinase